MADGKGGSFGQTLGYALIPQTMTAIDNAREKRDQKSALQDLIGSAFPIPGTAQNAPRPAWMPTDDSPNASLGGIPYKAPEMWGANQQKAVDSANLFSKLAKVSPETAFTQLGSRLLPKPPQFQKLGPGDIGGFFDDEGNFKQTASAPFAPKAAEAPTTREKKLPNRMAIQQEWSPEGWKDLGSPYSLDAPDKADKADKPWRAATPTDVQRFNVDPRAGRYITNGPDIKLAPGSEPQAGYRWNSDYTAQEPITGSQADVGRGGLPQAYKSAKAAINTLRSSTKEYEQQFRGSPVYKTDKSGVPILDAAGKPIVLQYKGGSGSEFAGKKAGLLDSAHMQIVLGIKDAANLGALDQGAMDAANKMISPATGWDGTFGFNSYREGQLDSFKRYLDEMEKNLDTAYKNGTWRPPEQTQQGGGASGGWSAREIKK